jgi:murein DD-endopeptidase MepM/ murein hydrolase activator NlpD
MKSCEMLVGKRPKGATTVRKDHARLQGIHFSRKHAWSGAAIMAVLVVGLFNSPGDEDAADTQVQVETEAIVESLAAVAAVDEPPHEPTAAAEPEQLEQLEQPEEEPRWVEVVVRKGDNLSLIFKRAGYNDRDVHRVVSESQQGKLLARIFPGQTISFQADDANELATVRYIKSPLETVVYQLSNAGFESNVEVRTPVLRETWATGTIISSLFLAGQEAGLSQNLIMELANVFGGVIDFVQDPRQGDTIQLVYEDLYLDGKKFKDGDIIAASFTNRGETFNAFRYTDTTGDVNYYNEDGVSMRKAFLLAPVDFTRISSNFNPSRLHPIYKTKRPHRGTDYAASRGTPVFAAGDGKVSKAGYSRANGNYVFIQHGNQYVTRYLHLHKRQVKKGQRVVQSQVIGTVGATGAATGPHLHYEFLMNGVHYNPRTIHKKLPKAKALPQKEMERFRRAINKSSTQLAALRSENQLAMSDPASSDAPSN